jgi:nucleotide-binding universal stress UspA family protein
MTPTPASRPCAGPRTANEARTGASPPARLLVCLDASEHASQALAEAIRLAGAAEGGQVTGLHAYAARLHDSRFRQMEGGLPERHRKEQEMENQRVVHDDLITRGLNIISDSYHDVAARACEQAGVPFSRLNAEGKNYRRIVEAAQSGDFDALVLGSVGLGRVEGSTIGTVCERVCRRSPIDTLIVRDPRRAIGSGPVVVGLDGSPRSYGALMTAFAVARAVEAPVHAVAAYDPFFHYVAFHKISGALSEDVAAQFRFEEQERLHEEIIDSGIARIYQSHLDVAKTIAGTIGTALETRLLKGKPWQAMLAYLNEVRASLAVVGKTGIHADRDLDIGGNAENLLRLAPCSVWLGQTVHTPPFEAIARETIAWTEEAEAMLERVPEAALSMVRMAILRFAQESGHTVITTALVEEATERFCPGRGGGEPAREPMARSKGARDLPETVGSDGAAVRMRAEQRARADRTATVEVARVRPVPDAAAAPAPIWSAAALARLARVPEMVRASLCRRVETLALDTAARQIDAGLVEAAIERSRAAMGEAMRHGGHRLGIDPSDQGS